MMRHEASKGREEAVIQDYLQVDGLGVKAHKYGEKRFVCLVAAPLGSPQLYWSRGGDPRVAGWS